MNKEQAFCMVDKDRLWTLSQEVTTLGFNLESFADLISTKAYDTAPAEEDLCGMLLFISRILTHFQETTATIADEIAHLESQVA